MLKNLVDSAIQKNAIGTGKRAERALLNENICDSQSKAEAFQEKNNVTDNCVFDLADVLTGPKIVSELTIKQSNLTKHYWPKNIIGQKTMYQRRTK